MLFCTSVREIDSVKIREILGNHFLEVVQAISKIADFGKLFKKLN